MPGLPSVWKGTLHLFRFNSTCTEMLIKAKLEAKFSRETFFSILPPVMWHETRPPNSLYCTLWKWLYLAGRHVGDRPVGLDGLQLVQAPVQLLQSLKRHPEKCFICKDKTLCEDDHWGAVSVPPRAAGWREEEFVIWLLMLWLDWRWPRPPWPSVPVTVVFLRDLKCPQLRQSAE